MSVLALLVGGELVGGGLVGGGLVGGGLVGDGLVGGGLVGGVLVLGRDDSSSTVREYRYRVVKVPSISSLVLPVAMSSGDRFSWSVIVTSAFRDSR